MTALDEVTPEEAPRAFFRKPTWQRVIVLSAGSITHFLIGMVLVYALAVSAGLPNLRNTPVVGELSCAANQGLGHRARAVRAGRARARAGRRAAAR